MTHSTEAASPRSRGLDTWPDADVLEALWESQADALAAVRPVLPALAAAAAAAAARLRRRGRLVYVGAGSSGRIAAQDGAELAPTFDWPEERLLLLLAGGDAALGRAREGAEDDADAAASAIAGQAIGPDDVVLGVAASGATPFTVAGIKQAAARGALTLGLANRPGPLLEHAAHRLLVETGAEVIAGSTRLKAGTAQKVALNLFSTLLMTRLGRVFDGRMVAMRPSNDKLRARARSMVAEIAGCDAAAAAAALAACGGAIRPAVLVARGRTAPAAQAALARHDGDLRAALNEEVA